MSQFESALQQFQSKYKKQEKRNPKEEERKEKKDDKSEYLAATQGNAMGLETVAERGTGGMLNITSVPASADTSCEHHAVQVRLLTTV